MIDDRRAIRKKLKANVGEFVWTQEHNLFGWRSLLGVVRVHRTSRLTQPLRARRISPGFRDVHRRRRARSLPEENMAYAERLSRARVPVEFHIYPGAYYGFH